MKKRKVTQKLNRYNFIDKSTKITTENFPSEESIVQPTEGLVEIDAMAGCGGLRLKWKRLKDGKFDTIVEEKVQNGWRAIGGIQKITIEIDAENVVPIVTMKRIIF